MFLEVVDFTLNLQCITNETSFEKFTYGLTTKEYDYHFFIMFICR